MLTKRLVPRHGQIEILILGHTLERRAGHVKSIHRNHDCTDQLCRNAPHF